MVIYIMRQYVKCQKEAIFTEKLVPLIMCAFIALIAFGLMKLALRISSAVTKKKILSYSRPSESAASAYLCACFGEGNVLSGVWLPCLDRLGRKMYAQADDIIVLPSGIYIVNISARMGRIDCDDEYLWHQSVRLRSGQTREEDFESPVFRNEKLRQSLEILLKKEQLREYPITCVTIFTSEKTVFSSKQKNVFTLAAGADFIASRKASKPVPRKERMTIIRAIRKNSPKASEARAFNRKNRVG